MELNDNDKKILISQGILLPISVICVFFVHVGFLGLAGCNIGFITGTLMKNRNKHKYYAVISKKVILLNFCIAIAAAVISFPLYRYSLVWAVIINVVFLAVIIGIFVRALKEPKR